MIQKDKQLDFTNIGLGVALCVIFFAIGYFATPVLMGYMNQNSPITTINCQNLTEKQYKDSPLYKDYKTLDEFRNACSTMQYELLNQTPKEFQLIAAIALPLFGGITFFRMFGVHKKILHD